LRPAHVMLHRWGVATAVHVQHIMSCIAQQVQRCDLQVALVSRFWTAPFTVVWALSFGFCFPWLPILGLFYENIQAPASSQAYAHFLADILSCWQLSGHSLPMQSFMHLACCSCLV